MNEVQVRFFLSKLIIAGVSYRWDQVTGTGFCFGSLGSVSSRRQERVLESLECTYTIVLSGGLVFTSRNYRHGIEFNLNHICSCVICFFRKHVGQSEWTLLELNEYQNRRL